MQHYSRPVYLKIKELTMTYDLANKTVLVTGANRGIGFGFVEALLARGIKRVYATTRDLSNSGELKALPDVVEVLQLDINSTESIDKLIAEIPELDVLINNAGVANISNFSSETSIAIATLEMQTNYFGTLQLTNKLLPALRKSSAAAIINVSSIAGISNFPLAGPYSASKAAVHSLTQGLRAELKSANIFVQGVYPGPTDTRMAEDVDMPKASIEQVANAVLNALVAGEEDVFPDEFSKAMYAIYSQSPKALEKEFSLAVG